MKCLRSKKRKSALLITTHTSAAFAALTMNVDDMVWVLVQPLASLAAELYHFHQKWWAVIFEGNALCARQRV